MADDDFAPDDLAPRPGDPQAARVLIGVLGESANADNVVLYLDLELRKRYEIPKSAIIRRQRLPAAQSPLGVDASMLWVRRDTTLTLQLNEPRHIEEEFLAGDFTAPASFTPTAPQPLRPPPTGSEACVSGIVACTRFCPPESQFAPCGSAVDACPTGFCPPESRIAVCASALDACPSRLTVCGSAVDACPTRLCASRFICGSAVDACPSRLCGTRSAICGSAVDACPTRLCGSRFACGSAVDACPTGFCPQGGPPIA